MRLLRNVRSGLTLVALGATLATGCGEDDPSSSTTTTNTETDETSPEKNPNDWDPSGKDGECNFDALLQPYSYGAKVKTLLTSLPLEDAELSALEADPAALGGLIDTWLEAPESRAILERFFMTAFQQNGGDNASFNYLMGRGAAGYGTFAAAGEMPKSAPTDQLLNENFGESFARTVADLVAAGKPFNEVLTTEEFQMTTAQMAFLAYLDDEVVADDKTRTLRTTPEDFKTFTVVKAESAAPPAAQALDPASANFGKFWQAKAADLNIPATGGANCTFGASEVITTAAPFPANKWRTGGGVSGSFWVFSQMLGRSLALTKTGVSGCSASAVLGEPMFTRNDFADWRTVKVRKPASGESRTVFYDLKSMRDATELVVSTERLGFATTPGFQSTWMNNEDNAARVTINQILIVALGKTFNPVAIFSDYQPNPPLDEEHVDAECAGCHQSLDPMREFVRGSFTNFYGEQENTEMKIQADFVFEGMKTQGNGIRGLAGILATHPAFPYAWAQKLCYYANSAACPEGPELDRVVGEFVNHNLDFRVLVKELFSSPLVTGRACVENADGMLDAGTATSIARRSTFCTELSNRLEVDDICAQHTNNAVASGLQKQVKAAISSLPDDTFSRAVVEPIVIAETSMFSRANQEAACTLIGQNTAFFTTAFGEMTVDEATDKMVTKLMGLPANDPRHAEVLKVLRDHVTEAVEVEGKTEAQALQSAFVISCMSPSIAGVGF